MHRLPALVALGVLLASGAAALGKLDPGAEKAAREYLTALSRNDRATMKRLTPSEPRDLYGPFFFKRLPVLRGPRVDSHRAAIDFEGESVDPELPPRGTITLVKLDERKSEAWVVRQVLWYDKKQLPLGVKVPDESVTEADQRQELEISRSARAFLLAWLHEDYARMKHLSFDWLSRKKAQEPPRFVKLRELRLNEAGALEGAIKVKYEARLTLIGFLPHRTSGFVYVLKEDGAWKVRGNNVSF